MMDLNKLQKLVEDDGIIFLSYGGFLSQTIISGMTEALEKEVEISGLNMMTSTNIFVIFIELSQNIMHYSKTAQVTQKETESSGLVVISKDDEYYYIQSQNIVSIEDKNRMLPKLQDITTLCKDDIKTKYKELRRSGKDTHIAGGGLGFYEIAKRSQGVEYSFTKIDDESYYFHIKTKIH